MSRSKTYRSIICRVGEDPVVEQVGDPFTFTKLRLIKNGLVQIVNLDEDGVLLYCDEEGQFNGSRPNRRVPARAPRLPEVDVVIEVRRDDQPFAKPGEIGYHDVHGDFLLGRHDPARDRPMDLTDDDLKKYLPFLQLTKKRPPR